VRLFYGLLFITGFLFTAKKFHTLHSNESVVGGSFYDQAVLKQFTFRLQVWDLGIEVSALVSIVGVAVILLRPVMQQCQFSACI
jgi:hypothetical protein